jgi:hypothetical protein
LCPVKVSASTPERGEIDRNRADGLDGVGMHRDPHRTRDPRSTTSRTSGCTVPTSLLAHIAETSATESGSLASESLSDSNAATSRRPSLVDRKQLDLGAFVPAASQMQRVEDRMMLDGRRQDAYVVEGRQSRREPRRFP